jgi:hypothetical protein
MTSEYTTISKPLQLPYFGSGLPAPLPTDAEIDAAPDLTPYYGHRRIVQVNSHYVVKFGTNVDLIEGENMLFVSENAGIPAPIVYALYSRGEGMTKTNYIVMSKIAGQTLQSLWLSLDSSDKKTITKMLHDYVFALRSLPSPGYYGALHRRSGLLEKVLMAPSEYPDGPFETDDALTEALQDIHRRMCRDGDRAEWYRRNFPRVLKHGRPTFTHGDLAMKNIMVEERKGSDAMGREDNADGGDGRRQWKVTILNWSSAGWLPVYWEYTTAACGFFWRKNGDWGLWFDEVMEPYLAEAAWMQDFGYDGYFVY